MGVSTGDPLHVAGLDLYGAGGLALDVAAEVQVGDGDDQVWAGVVMAGYGRARLQLGLGYAHAVLHKHDVLRPAGQDMQAAFFVPLRRRRLVGGFVLQQFDRYGAEWRACEVARDVGKSALRKTGFAVLHFESDRRLAFNFVRDVGLAERNENVVVAMAMQQGRIVRGDLSQPHPDLLVFEKKMVVGLSGDRDLGCILRGQRDGGEQECGEYQMAFHESRF